MKTITATGLLLGILFLLGASPLIQALAGWSMEGNPAVAAAMDTYEIRSGLLMNAMDRVGVCAPEDAARLWADGVAGRSAALQYAALSQRLKGEYAAQLEQTFPNWVTGVSSPWVEQYEIVKSDHPSHGHYTYQLRFFTATSSGPAGTLGACLIVAEEDGFWRVAALAYDDGLAAYTGFQPR